MPAETALAAETLAELACLQAQGRLYGVDVRHVREVVRGREVTPLPRAPALIEGVIDLRGAVLPVVDLGRALGGAPAVEGPAARIAVLDVGDLAFGLRVDAALEVIPVSPEDLRETPPLAARAGYDVVRAVVRRPGGAPVLVLSLESLLAAVQGDAREAAS